MPNLVESRLNVNVQSTFSVAELNGTSRAFVGVAMQNVAGQRIFLSGLLWSVFPFVSADKSLMLLSIFIQRGLVLDASTSFGFAENHAEQLFNIQPDGRFDSFTDKRFFTQPLILEGGYNWAIVMEIIMIGGAATGQAIATLSALGVQAFAGDEPFPYRMR